MRSCEDYTPVELRSLLTLAALEILRLECRCDDLQRECNEKTTIIIDGRFLFSKLLQNMRETISLRSLRAQRVRSVPLPQVPLLSSPQPEPIP